MLPRLADAHDLPGIMRIEQECFGEERFTAEVVLSLITRADAFTMVAESEGRMVGAAMGMFSQETGEGKIASVAVLKRYRRRGIGTRLLEACEEIFRSYGLSLFTLEVEVTNEPAVALYASRGYMIEEVLAGFYSRGRDAYRMVKRGASRPRGR